MSSESQRHAEDKMQKTISVLKEELSTMRVGRANPTVLNKIMVNYYGVPTPIAQIGNISVPEPRLLLIQPWDASILKEIEKEIQKSDIGLNPTNDGKVIRLVFPELTEERRKELVKLVKKMGEESKVALRSIRRDAIETCKTMKKNNEMTEDELKVAEDDIQKVTDKYVDEIDKLVETKEKEVLSV